MHEGLFEITLTVLLIRRWVPSSPTQLKEAEENLVNYIQTPSEGENMIITIIFVIFIVFFLVCENIISFLLIIFIIDTTKRYFNTK